MKSLSVHTIVIALAFTGGGLAAQDNEVKELHIDGVTIECSPELAPVARELAPWVASRLKEVGFGKLDAHSFLEKNEEAVLAFIAEKLAMAAPGEHMRTVSGFMLKAYARIKEGLPDPSHLRLWSREELIRFLDDGGDLRGYTFDRNANTFEFRGGALVTSKGPVQSTRKPGYVPILMMPREDETPLDAARRKVEAFLAGFPEGQVPVGAAFHEIAEFAMLSDVGISGSRRRWFLDGTANYVAWAGLRKFMSPQAAQDFLKAYDVRRFEDIKGKVRLAQWLPMKIAGRPTSREEKRLDYARYCFATHEIMGLVERHGEDVIPKIFRELQKVEAEAHKESSSEAGPEARPELRFGKPVITIDAVLDAIQTVTGEDFRERLSVYDQQGKGSDPAT